MAATIHCHGRVCTQNHLDRTDDYSPNATSNHNTRDHFCRKTVDQSQILLSKVYMVEVCAGSAKAALELHCACRES